MKLAGKHVTRYWYSDDVSTSHTEIHLTPRNRPGQVVLEHQLKVSPEPDFLVNRFDYFGNPVASFSVEQPHRELVVTAECLVDLTPQAEPYLAQSPPWEEAADMMQRRPSLEALEASQFIFESPLIQTGPMFAAYASESFVPGRPLLEAANDLSGRIYREFKYDPRATTISTPVDEVLLERHGVCQDFAHVMIACMRSLGLPARYVSGYLRTGMVGSEASHAWLAVWCPVLGWQDFDPTNNVIPQSNHVTLGWGRDYSDVTPVKGVALGGGEHVVQVSMELKEVEGDRPRPGSPE